MNSHFNRFSDPGSSVVEGGYLSLHSSATYVTADSFSKVVSHYRAMAHKAMAYGDSKVVFTFAPSTEYEINVEITDQKEGTQIYICYGKINMTK